MPSLNKRKVPLKIGLAFGSGGARGWAHVGVMRRLAELDIQPCCVAGASIGAIAGAAFLADRRAALEKVAEVADWRFMLKIFGEVGIPGAGVLKGRHVEDFLRKLLRPFSRIEDFPIPFATVATDVRRGEEIEISSGDLITAIHASLAIPGIFSPVRRSGRYLIDGGIIDPVPVSVARSLGAEIVIAVDINLRRSDCPATIPRADDARDFYSRVYKRLDHLALEFPQMTTTVLKVKKRLDASSRKPTMMEVLTQTMRIMENKTTEARLKEEMPEILIQPAVGNVQTLDFTCAKDCIEAGYAAACENESLTALSRA